MTSGALPNGAARLTASSAPTSKAVTPLALVTRSVPRRRSNGRLADPMTRATIPLFCASLCLLAGCGARSPTPEAEKAVTTTEPAPVALYVADGAGCVAEPPLDTAADVIR